MTQKQSDQIMQSTFGHATAAAAAAVAAPVAVAEGVDAVATRVSTVVAVQQDLRACTHAGRPTVSGHD